jgi:hypothetical protein
MTNFSQTTFGKNLEELNYEDIKAYFITEREETNRLEFKSYNTLEKNDQALAGVTRAISALLNSEGGLVIWGAPKGERNKDKVQVFKGDLCPGDTSYEKDWLINKVSDNITSLPMGIRVRTITHSNKEFVYIFEIQESHYKPHQYQGIYNVRLDGQTKPAPHYLVDALFRQIKFPLIEGYLKFTVCTKVNLLKLRTKFNVYLYNFSQLQPEESVTFSLRSSKGEISKGYSTYVSSGAVPALHYGQPTVEAFSLDLEHSLLTELVRYVEISILFKAKKFTSEKILVSNPYFRLNR